MEVGHHIREIKESLFFLNPRELWEEERKRPGEKENQSNIYSDASFQ